MRNLESENRISFYILVWNFLLGSIMGYIIEVTFYFYKRGYFVNRQGVLFGPFNQIYGFGILILLVFLFKFRNKKIITIFIASVIIGTVFEYISHILIENVLGYVTWNYSKFPFNFQGKVCLLVSVVWGIIGTVYIKLLYPLVPKLLNRLNEKFYKIFTWIFMIFMVINLSFSTLAIERMRERSMGIQPENKIEEFLDKNYPDEKLKSIFCSLKFVE